VLLDGEELDVPEVGGETKGTATLRVFLSGGINKITVNGDSKELVLDRLRVASGGGTLVPTVYQAENGTLTGAAKVTTAYPFAAGGKAVTDIGSGKGNALTLDVAAECAGRHALTIRYSNGEQAPSTHYHPRPHRPARRPLGQRRTGPQDPVPDDLPLQQLPGPDHPGHPQEGHEPPHFHCGGTAGLRRRHLQRARPAILVRAGDRPDRRHTAGGRIALIAHG
jgi:hypothetical protein